MSDRSQPSSKHQSECIFLLCGGVEAKHDTMTSSSLHVTTFPQMGYMIAIPHGEVVDAREDPTLYFRFSGESL